MQNPSDPNDLPYLHEDADTPPEAPPGGGTQPPATPAAEPPSPQAAPVEQPKPPPPPTPRETAAPAPTAFEAEAVRRGKSAVIPPAILAQRMQRYSIYLMVLAFLIIGANYQALTLSTILWFAAVVAAVFALLCAIAVILLNAIAWNFDRLARELRGDQKAVDLSGR